jgi:hypothetical protein
MFLPKALYIGYMAGHAGNAIGLFYIGDGLIYGIDAGLVRYEGRYLQKNKNSSLVGTIEMIFPEGSQLITGPAIGDKPGRIAIQLELGPDFANGDIVRIETPYGPVNSRFEKVHDVP